MLKLEDNPPILYPLDTPLDGIVGTWWVAHTKPRQEKALANGLAARGTAYFLPMLERMNVIRGRRLTSLIPLFPSYVFVCGADDERLAMFAGRRVVRTLAVADQARLVRELMSIRLALESGAPLQRRPYLGRGRRCRVSSGPFQGVEGIVSRQGGGARLVLSVETLGQSVALEIDERLLEQAD